MVTYVDRSLDPLIAELFAELPALSIVGPRASGKTTTAARHVERVVRLDRPDEAAAFRASPDAAIAALEGPTLFDEWQEVPELLGAVKRAVDHDGAPGRFLLTGSVRAELDVATWPGTGRIVPLTMHPLTQREIVGTARTGLVDRLVAGETVDPPVDPPNLTDYVDMALRGGFPEAALGLTDSTRRRWLEGYVTQTVARDAPGIGRRDVEQLRRYFSASALHTAGVIEQTAIARDVAVDRKTGAGYDDLLHRLVLVDSPPPWTTNRLKRLIRNPKRFLVDASLLVGLAGVDRSAILADGGLLGRMIETFVASQLRVEQAVSSSRFRTYHLRQHDGRREVDFVVEFGAESIIGIEVKSSSAPVERDARHLSWLRDSHPERFVSGLVLHTGPGVYELGDRITAAPIACFWS